MPVFECLQFLKRNRLTLSVYVCRKTNLHGKKTVVKKKKKKFPSVSPFLAHEIGNKAIFWPYDVKLSSKRLCTTTKLLSLNFSRSH
jgi:hypothetical protein